MSDIATIKREHMNADCQAAYDMLVEAVDTLRQALVKQAVEAGQADEGMDAKLFLRYFPQSVGMQLTVAKAVKAQGFEGLKRPTDPREAEAIKLAQWRASQASSGRRF